jgi:hypothetical protein
LFNPFSEKEFGMKDDEVYVSPFFAFNLKGFESQPKFQEKEFFGEISMSTQAKPNHASQIELQIIKNPNLFNNEENQTQKDLKDFENYFNKPRVLNHGDVFGIYDGNGIDILISKLNLIR